MSEVIWTPVGPDLERVKTALLELALAIQSYKSERDVKLVSDAMIGGLVPGIYFKIDRITKKACDLENSIFEFIAETRNA